MELWTILKGVVYRLGILMATSLALLQTDTCFDNVLIKAALLQRFNCSKRFSLGGTIYTVLNYTDTFL